MCLKLLARSNEQLSNGEAKRHEGYLPHWQQKGKWVFVTWRLKDALPQEKIRRYMEEKKAWILKYPKPRESEVTALYYKQFLLRIEAWLDSGLGECVLGKIGIANKVGDALEYFDGQRYTLATYVVMPNHVHVLFRLN